jgi:lysozyme
VKISETGLRLIAALEGFSPQPYRNAVGDWAIGFGHTYGVTEQTPEIAEAEAHELLIEDIGNSYGPAIDALGLPLTQSQFDAVCSFVYQLGVGVLSRSSPFGSHLLVRDWLSAGNAMLLYDRQAGAEVPALQHRRKLERAMFLAPPPPAPTSLGVLSRGERVLAERYNDGLAHAPMDPEALARMREQLAVLRQLVWVAAVRGHESDGTEVRPGWDVDLRRERYELLSELSGWTG